MAIMHADIDTRSDLQAVMRHGMHIEINVRAERGGREKISCQAAEQNIRAHKGGNRIAHLAIL